jgi:hypothetical protein
MRARRDEKSGGEALHLATGLVVGYPPCPYIAQFKAIIETANSLPVIVGTHPVPQSTRTSMRSCLSGKTRNWRNSPGRFCKKLPKR